MTRAAAAVTAAAGVLLLALPAHAAGARFAVGLAPGASPGVVAARAEALTGGHVSHGLLELGALTLEAESAAGVRGVRGVAYVERIDGRRRLAWTPADPLFGKQWYLDATRAFSAWAEPPPLVGPLVALIDSGIDGDHPEFRDRIAGARSFVGGKATTDQQGHGTFVAGILAAAHDGKGTVGVAFPSRLLVAKVVGPDGTISLEAEAKAIRWAADSGARVINLSLGGVRDPLNPRNDTYSPLEAAAVDYAHRRGAVLVAAVGNGDQAPRRPWLYASYPAALPHVIGVSALARDGSVPEFSDRDQIYNDIAAPGQDMLSTLPRPLTASRPACSNQGYSDCGPDEYRVAEGTSFAAPQVAGAAALLLSVRPELTADQVSTILTRSATDANASTGCRACPLQRDALSGWGRVNVEAAVAQATAGRVPVRDRYETNDEAGSRAHTLWARRSATIRATLDFWDDQTDVYRIRLAPRQRLFLALKAQGGTKMFLWRPRTTRVEGLAVRGRLVQSRFRASAERLAYTAPRGGGGWYFIQVKMQSPGWGPYTLSLEKRAR